MSQKVDKLLKRYSLAVLPEHGFHFLKFKINKLPRKERNKALRVIRNDLRTLPKNFKRRLVPINERVFTQRYQWKQNGKDYSRTDKKDAE